MSVFHFKHFQIQQATSAMKVGTDALVLGALLSEPNAEEVLDVGSGTGVLSLMFAQRHPLSRILALELDPAAARECALNCRNSPWSNRLACLEANFCTWGAPRKFDLIISNPPYFQTGKGNTDDRMRLARHVAELSPEVFFRCSNAVLSAQGKIALILPASDEDLWQEAARMNGFYCKKQLRVFGKREGIVKRLVLWFSRRAGDVQCEQLTIREADGCYTPEYIELTKEFHGVDLNT
ncbi:MAG: hypothetical protein A3D92_14685 [Bacteroidetes bacterium RIFCSPHIGHO2_02_FULL_44_7]|nr:MAG: hypothetical protein A3D92_14685 [Bacteroidetes bacterium RIFCSPHIGHO2_02_FULL_44_7]